MCVCVCVCVCVVLLDWAVEYTNYKSVDNSLSTIFQDMTLEYLTLSFLPRNLENVEYPFIAINPTVINS